MTIQPGADLGSASRLSIEAAAEGAKFKKNERK